MFGLWLISKCMERTVRRRNKQAKVEENFFKKLESKIVNWGSPCNNRSGARDIFRFSFRESKCRKSVIPGKISENEGKKYEIIEYQERHKLCFSNFSIWLFIYEIKNTMCFTNSIEINNFCVLNSSKLCFLSTKWAQIRHTSVKYVSDAHKTWFGTKKSNLLVNISMFIKACRAACFSSFPKNKYGGNFRVRKLSSEKVFH